MTTNKPRITFLAGAGLSMSAELPGAIAIVERFKAALSQKPPLTETVPNELLTEVLRFFPCMTALMPHANKI